MGWTPPDGIEVPEWRCLNTTAKEASVGEVITVGLDLAKHVFQVHAIDAAAITRNYGDSAFISGTSLIVASISAIASIECTVAVMCCHRLAQLSALSMLGPRLSPGRAGAIRVTSE